jgi:hypothetical protein
MTGVQEGRGEPGVRARVQRIQDYRAAGGRDWRIEPPHAVAVVSVTFIARRECQRSFSLLPRPCKVERPVHQEPRKRWVPATRRTPRQHLTGDSRFVGAPMKAVYCR